MGIRSLKIGLLAKGALVLAAGAFLAASAVPAHAVTLRASKSSTSANGSGTAGGPTGNYLFTYYDIGTPEGTNPKTASPNFGFPNGDNVLRLIDPNGCGNGGTSNTACGSEVDECAMIYVFDDDQEMGECCGCLITPNGLNTYSVRNDLVSNWANSTHDNGRGVIAVVGSSINDPGNGFTSNGCGNGNNKTCNDGCDPTLAAVTTTATNLDGSITHDQLIAETSGLTEISLFDQGQGETVNNAYLVAECGVLTGNGSHTNGFCNCPDTN